MRTGPRRVLWLFRVALVATVAALFWVPALRATYPFFPAPLDDVYIYFDFARSTANGCVLCWTTGTGYSSGATSPLYALVLSVGYLMGFRGLAIGWFAAAVACISTFDLTGSMARLAGPADTKRGAVAAALACLLVAGVPLLSWTLVSGMEAAFVGALVGRALVAIERLPRTAPHLRGRAQLRAGIWLALVAAGRPECIPLAFALAVAVAHAAGSRSVLASLGRAVGPAALLVGTFTLFNAACTSDVAASGAIRKLVTSDPYATNRDAALLVALNALRLYTVGFEVALGGPWVVRAFLVLVIVPLFFRETRRLAVALCAGAFASFLLVTLNKTAPFQNLRYLAPTWLMLLASAALGLKACFSRSRWSAATAAALALFVVGSASRELGHQTTHFAKSSKNIREQQVEVGLRIAAMTPPARRVFVGDAGAIPYVSGAPALDGLGLGGFRDLPFARASVHGIGAVIELIERLGPDERPDVLAIYDAWWPNVGARFGERAFSVRIEDNVICADPEKVVYRADWRLLEDRAALSRGALFRIDVADLVDERAFHLDFSHPRGGYVTTDVRTDPSGRSTFDAQRILAAGQRLGFEVPSSVRCGPARLTITTSSAPGTKLTLDSVGHASTELTVADHDEASWGQASADLEDLCARTRVTLIAIDPIEIGSIRADAR